MLADIHVEFTQFFPGPMNVNPDACLFAWYLKISTPLRGKLDKSV